MIEKKILSYYSNKNILVTGAAGYIGSTLIRALLHTKCNIIALIREKKELPFLSDGLAKVKTLTADIRDKKIWEGLLGKIDILFHFAAQTSSRFSNDNPSLDAEINLLPVVNIIEICQKNNYHPDIIYSGTTTEVGFTKKYPIDETFQDRPITVYDINKLCAEKYLQYYSSQLGNRSVILRLANVYGPGVNPSSPDRGILNSMIHRAINNQAITIYGKGDFVRDYIYITDICAAFLFAAAKIDLLNGEYYLIGSGKGCTIKEAFLEIKSAVEKFTHKKVKIIHMAIPKHLSKIEVRNFVANTHKFKDITNWKAEVSLKEGIEKTLSWFLQGVKE